MIQANEDETGIVMLTTQVNLAILGGHAVTESGKGTYKFRPQF